jgi:hypothetical protein
MMADYIAYVFRKHAVILFIVNLDVRSFGARALAEIPFQSEQPRIGFIFGDILFDEFDITVVSPGETGASHAYGYGYFFHVEFSEKQILML